LLNLRSGLTFPHAQTRIEQSWHDEQAAQIFRFTAGSTIHTVSSSWAIATTRQPQNIWKGGALIWEDSQNYLYARTTSAGRIIIGGEDSDKIIEPESRDALIPERHTFWRESSPRSGRLLNSTSNFAGPARLTTPATDCL
jgi:hypothetical protein